MYQPDAFREFRRQQYSGTVRPPVTKTFVRVSDEFDVQRPEGYIMRANPDIDCVLQVSAPIKEITLPGAFRGDKKDTVVNAKPHHLSMPIGQLTTGCSFHPETSADFFESNPSQLIVETAL